MRFQYDCTLVLLRQSDCVRGGPVRWTQAEPSVERIGRAPQEQLAAHRDYLYPLCTSAPARRVARRGRRSGDSAGRDGESIRASPGRAQLRTWLTGILKHKIIDVFRRQSRETPLETGPEASRTRSSQTCTSTRRIATTGTASPTTWGNPEKSLEQKRFWEIFDACSQQMPPQIARVFTMRELMGLETEEICKELGITANNCWVMLYRARMSLRQCLETRWFQQSY